jgi:hypothetical protein
MPDLAFRTTGYQITGPAASLSDAFQLVPVRITIAKRDLFSSPEAEDPWLNLPVPDVARWGMACLHESQRTGRSGYELEEYGEALLFLKRGNKFLVHSTMNGLTVQCQYATLLDAWKSFASSVRSFLVQNFPVVSDHPNWRDWMARDLVEDVPGLASALGRFALYEREFGQINAVEP